MNRDTLQAIEQIGLPDIRPILVVGVADWTAAVEDRFWLTVDPGDIVELIYLEIWKQFDDLT